MKLTIVNIGKAYTNEVTKKTSFPINVISKTGEVFTLWRSGKLLTLDLENNYDDLSSNNLPRADFAGGTVEGAITLEREGTPFKYTVETQGKDGKPITETIEGIREHNTAVVDGFLSILKSEKAAEGDKVAAAKAKFAGVPTE